jgi:anaphase-promoting complex subunit 5
MISEVRLQYLIGRGRHEAAFSALEDLSLTLKEDGADLSHRISVLNLKAHLLWKAGQCERGFSVALRAASVSFKARLMPKLWLAAAQMCANLNALGEFEAAARILHALIPQALEHSDQALEGLLLSHLADSQIGSAGMVKDLDTNGVRLQSTNINRGEVNIDRARGCKYNVLTMAGERYTEIATIGFRKIEDIEGECEQLMKKAILAKLRGDEQLAEEWAQNHNRVWERDHNDNQ